MSIYMPNSSFTNTVTYESIMN